jgi:membrane protease YdiL (CAAX protease family)
VSDLTPPLAPPHAPPQAFAPRPRLWTLAVTIAVLLVGFVLLTAVVFTGIALLTGPDPIRGGAISSTERMLEMFSTVRGLLLTAGVSSLWIGGVSLVAGALSPRPFVRRLGLVPPDLSLFGLAIVIVGGLAASQAGDAFLQWSGLGHGEALEHMFQVFRAARGWDVVYAVIVIGLLAGLAEELLFRGYFQRRLVERFGPLAGIAIASVLFALAHFDLRHSLFALGFGAYVGWIAWRTDSIWPGVLVHVVNNTISVLQIASGMGDAPMSKKTSGLVLAASLVALAAAVAGLRALRPYPGRSGPAARGATVP